MIVPLPTLTCSPPFSPRRWRRRQQARGALQQGPAPHDSAHPALRFPAPLQQAAQGPCSAQPLCLQPLSTLQLVQQPSCQPADLLQLPGLGRAGSGEPSPQHAADPALSGWSCLSQRWLHEEASPGDNPSVPPGQLLSRAMQRAFLSERGLLFLTHRGESWREPAAQEQVLPHLCQPAPYQVFPCCQCHATLPSHQS